MENAIYNSMIAANQLLEKQTIISNNLANISTIGFKEKFNYIINRQNEQNTYKKDIKNVKEYYNLSTGTLIYTERNLDVFIKNNGWLVVKDAHGQEAYTKNGHLKINSQGKLTIQNHELIGNHCNINIPKNVNLEILPNGIINSINQNNTKNKIGCLKLVHLPIEHVIQKENGFFYLNKNSKHYKNFNTVLHDNNIRLQSGMLEESNVNPTKNMIDMISNVRQFEIQMKIISSCDQNSEYANQLLNINN